VTTETRAQTLLAWASGQLRAQQVIDHGDALRISALAGDASFRRYYRVLGDDQCWIIADAPPATEKNREFVDIASRLLRAGVPAPRVISADLEQGYLLLSDLGDQTLLDHLNPDSVAGFYAQAIDLAVAMQGVESEGLPPYDRTLLWQEMSLFNEWFVEALLAYRCNEQEQARTRAVFDVLAGSACAQPQVFVHRDFHSRNIMVVADDLAAIDFQDGVKGPLTYDLVSLLRDCYISWPESQVEQWLTSFEERLRTAGLLDEQIGSQQLRQWFDFMGLQRHIKVLGIFARLCLRDNKAAYLHDLPLVIAYTRQVLGLYANKADVASGEVAERESFAVLADWLLWFDEKLMPLIEKQPWYRPIVVGESR
jgi:hypothetical protein